MGLLDYLPSLIAFLAAGAAIGGAPEGGGLDRIRSEEQKPCPLDRNWIGPALPTRNGTGRRWEASPAGQERRKRFYTYPRLPAFLVYSRLRGSLALMSNAESNGPVSGVILNRVRPVS